MNIRRAQVATFKLGDVVTLNYINHLENETVLFRVDSLPTKYIPSFTLIEINPKSEHPRKKEELVQYITKFKSKKTDS